MVPPGPRRAAQPPASSQAPALSSALTKSALRSVCLFPAGLYDDVGLGFVSGTNDGRVGVTFLPELPAKQGSGGSPAAAALGAPAPTAREARWGSNFTFKCHRSGTAPQQVAYPVHAVAFSPRKPEHLATAGGDGEVCLWDVKRRERQGQLVAAPGGVGGATG